LLLTPKPEWSFNVCRTKKQYEIVVNGSEHDVPSEFVTYAQVVEIAFPGHPTNPDVVFSVTFEHAQSKPHEGTLAEGGQVEVKKKGTIFDVTQTTRS
jgi:hypothetical protein